MAPASDTGQFIVSIFKYGTTWKKFPGVAQSPGHKRHNYTETLLGEQVTSCMKMGSRDAACIILRAWGRILCGLSHTDSAVVTGALG